MRREDRGRRRIRIEDPFRKRRGDPAPLYTTTMVVGIYYGCRHKFSHPCLKKPVYASKDFSK
jgi:hypothetical protein